MHVVEAAKIGADVMTAPPKIIHQLFKHPLTDTGIASFLKDWEATGSDDRLNGFDATPLANNQPIGKTELMFTT